MDATHPLKAYRETARLTQLGLADLLGVARTTVARWETGERNIDDDLLPKVSEVTGIPKTELRPDLVDLLKQEVAE
jgi:transcriptional regulator with XRE-family HTH domain